MKDIPSSRKTGRLLYVILIILACMATTSFAALSAEIETDRENYCHMGQINFDATVRLTECEQINDVKLMIGSTTCSLPKSYGYYPAYGNCELDVTVTETNPDNCYTYGGSNTVNYQITWNIPTSLQQGIYEADIMVNTAVGSTSAATAFSTVCVTTTTSTTSTTTTTHPPGSTTTLPTNLTTTTSTSLPCINCCTTTTLHKKYVGGGNDGGYPAKPGRVVASCNDSIKNYGETDVDCGGLICQPCDDGKHCIKDNDCKSKYCYYGICTTVSCSDGIQNQDETDIDCGGPCDKCDIGKRCRKNSDCTTDYCQNGICANQAINKGCEITPNCTDQIRNGDETDVDCGGSCKQCSDGKRCQLDSDCTNNYCYQGICKTPTCSDGVKNQGETGIDCGGPCKACATGGVIGYITSISGDLGNILMILIIVLLLALLFLYLSKKRRYVAAADFLNAIENDDDLDKFINKKRPCVVAGTSRKIRRLKKHIDDGKIDIIWIKDWDYVNELINKGLDDNSAESIALAKQLKAGIFIQSPEAKKIAEEAGLKAYDKP